MPEDFSDFPVLTPTLPARPAAPNLPTGYGGYGAMLGPAQIGADFQPPVAAAPRPPSPVERFDDFPTLQSLAPMQPASEMGADFQPARPIPPLPPSPQQAAAAQWQAQGVDLGPPLAMDPAVAYNHAVEAYRADPAAARATMRQGNVQVTPHDLIESYPPVGGGPGPGTEVRSQYTGTQSIPRIGPDEHPLYAIAQDTYRRTGDPRFLAHAALQAQMAEGMATAGVPVPGAIRNGVGAESQYVRLGLDDLPDDWKRALAENVAAIHNPGNQSLRVPHPWVMPLPDGTVAVRRGEGRDDLIAWYERQTRPGGAAEGVSAEQQAAQLDAIRQQRQADPYPGGLRAAVLDPAEQAQFQALKGQMLDRPRPKNTVSEDVLNVPGATMGRLDRMAGGVASFIDRLPTPPTESDTLNPDYNAPTELHGGGGMLEDVGNDLMAKGRQRLEENPIDRAVPRAVTMAPEIAAMFAAGGVGGAPAIMAAGGVSAAGNAYAGAFDDVYHQARADGLSDADAKERAHRAAFAPAVISGVAGSVLNALRLPIDDPAAGVIVNAVRHMMAGAGIGAVQDAADQLGQRLGYGRPIDLRQTIESAMDNAFLSAGIHLARAGAEALADRFQARRSPPPPAAPGTTPPPPTPGPTPPPPPPGGSAAPGATPPPPPGATPPPSGGPQPGAQPGPTPPPPGAGASAGGQQYSSRRGFRMDEAAARQTLGLDPLAPLDAAAVKRAWRESVMRSHPDNGGTAAQFQRVSEAYDALRGIYGDAGATTTPPPGARRAGEPGRAAGDQPGASAPPPPRPDVYPQQPPPRPTPAQPPQNEPTASAPPPPPRPSNAAEDISAGVRGVAGGVVDGMYDRMWADVTGGRVDPRTAPIADQVVDHAYREGHIQTRDEMAALAREAQGVADGAPGGQRAQAVRGWYGQRFPASGTPAPGSPGETVHPTPVPQASSGDDRPANVGSAGPSVESWKGQSVIVRGVERDPEGPFGKNGIRGIWNASEGAYVVPQVRADQARAAVDQLNAARASGPPSAPTGGQGMPRGEPAGAGTAAPPLPERRGLRRREVKARLERGEFVPPEVVGEFEGEHWLQQLGRSGAAAPVAPEPARTDLPPVSPSGEGFPAPAGGSEAADARTAPPKRDVRPALFRRMAEALTPQIEAKKNPAIANQNPTRRRASIADGMYQEGERLAKVQRVLRGMADAAEGGTLPPSLAGIRTRAQVEDLLRRGDRFEGPTLHKAQVRELFDRTNGVRGSVDLKNKLAHLTGYPGEAVPITPGELPQVESLIGLAEKAGVETRWMKQRLADGKRLLTAGITNTDQLRAAKRDVERFIGEQRPDPARETRRMENDLLGRDLPGFFPTPRPLIDRMIQAADIRPTDTVLEPSAGKGDIADALTERVGRDRVDTYEVHPDLRKILQAKGYPTSGTDFLEGAPRGRYDRIVMNPPFENGQDMTHVMAAYNALKPGGRLVAIMSEGPFFRQDATAQTFRGWLEEVGGRSEKNDAKAFTGREAFRQTGTATRMVVIDKPVTAAAPASPVAPAAPPQAVTVEPYRSQSFIVRGVEKGPRSVFGRDGLRGVWSEKERGYIFAKGRREAVQVEVDRINQAQAGGEGSAATGAMPVIEPRAHTPANESPQQGERRPSRRPVKAKPPRLFSKADVERRLLQHYDQTEGAADFERKTQAEAQVDEVGAGGASDVFRGNIPTSLIGEFTEREWAQVIRRRIVRVGKAGETTGGEDAYSEHGMGHDRYVQMVRDRLNGTKTRSEGLESKTTRAIEHARQSPDPEMQLLAAIHDNMPPAQQRGPTGVIKPADLPTGTTFSLNGARFEIVVDGEGHRLLKDGDEYPVVPADYIDAMPADLGSVRGPEEAPAAARTAPVPYDDLAQRIERAGEDVSGLGSWIVQHVNRKAGDGGLDAAEIIEAYGRSRKPSPGWRRDVADALQRVKGKGLLKTGWDDSGEPFYNLPERQVQRGPLSAEDVGAEEPEPQQAPEAQAPGERPQFFDPAADGIKSGAGTGIFGQTTFEPATGNRQGTMFHEPTDAQGPAESAQDARIRGKYREGEAATGGLYGEAPQRGEEDGGPLGGDPPEPPPPGRGGAGGFGGRRGGGVYIGWLEHPIQWVGGTAQMLKGAFDWYSRPLLESVEAQAGTTGKQIASTGRKINDYARGVVGELNLPMNRALVYASGRSKPGRRAVRQLREVRWVATPDVTYGYSAFQSAVEDQAPPGVAPLTVSPDARRAVLNHRELMMATGKIAVRDGWQVVDAGAPRPFVPARDGKRLVRSFTSEYWDIASRPDNDPMKEAVAKAIGHANGRPWQDMLREISQSTEPPTTKQNAAEEVRTLRFMPTHVQHPDTGKPVQIVNSEPFEAAVHLVRSFSLRAGYVKHVGQDLPGAGNPTQGLIDAFTRNGGDPRDIKDLVRTFHGIPLDPITWATPGTWAYSVVRLARGINTLAKSGALTAAWVPNLFETLTKTWAMTGTADYLAAWQALLTHPAAAARATADLGARTVDVHSWLGREGHPFEAAVRNISYVVNAPLKFANELNELQSAVAGQRFAAGLAGQGEGSRDAATLRLLGYTDDEVRDLTGPVPSPDLLASVPGRVAEQTQGTTSRPSEIPRSQHNRLFRTMMPFQSWPAMTANRIAKMAGNIVRPGLTPKQRLAHARVLAAFLFGSAAAGTMAALLMAYVRGGRDEVVVRYREAQDDPRSFLYDAMKFSMLGGLATVLYESLTDNHSGSLIVPLLNASIPLSLIDDLFAWRLGIGRYRGMSLLEGAAELLRHRVAIAPSIATHAAGIGLSDHNPNLDSALRAYYRWRRQNPPAKGEDGPDVAGPTGEAFKFARAMRQFQEAANRGEDDDAAAALGRALGVKAEELAAKQVTPAVAEAIRSRQLLTHLKEDQYEALQKHIGPEAFDQLEEWDAVLEGWARAVKPKAIHLGGR